MTLVRDASRDGGWAGESNSYSVVQEKKSKFGILVRKLQVANATKLNK